MKTNTLLVPVDFSPVSRFVLDEAVKLACLTQSQIVLLHVVQPPAVVSDYGPLMENIVELTAQAEKSAAQQLARWQEKLQARGIATKTVIQTGLPVGHILEQAKKVSASQIVLGSHGHTAFYDLLIGSTTSGVLKRATCPVVVVPAPQRKQTRKK